MVRHGGTPTSRKPSDSRSGYSQRSANTCNLPVESSSAPGTTRSHHLNMRNIVLHLRCSVGVLGTPSRFQLNVWSGTRISGWHYVAMPRYFIDTSDGDCPLIDDEGQEFPTDQAARDAAMDALPDMARDALPDGDERTFAVAVRNEQGRAIYSAKLILKGRWH